MPLPISGLETNMKITVEILDEVKIYLNAPEGDFPADRIPVMEEILAWIGLPPRSITRANDAKKAETNRANAQKSTGPKSAAGKAASSKNRLSHGLCSQDLLVANETAEEFDHLLASIRNAYQPATEEEKILTDQVAQSLWRYNRALRVESEVINDTMADESKLPKATPSMMIEFALSDRTLPVERVNRYVVSFERSYLRAVKLLQLTQKTRRELPVPPAPPQVEPVPEPLKYAVASSPLPEYHYAVSNPAFKAKMGFQMPPAGPVYSFRS